MKPVTEWYVVKNIEEVDSPALLIYKDRVKNNIETLIRSIDQVNRLRPHVKTHKSAEVTQLMIQAGIRKFKCATIAEAEMLANVGASDILLAYQPVGPKAERLAELAESFSKIKFACLIDNFPSASHLASVFSKIHRTIPVYIDLNVGMNRTGINPESARELFVECASLQALTITGLHAYDGHIRDVDYEARRKKCDEAFLKVGKLKKNLDQEFNVNLTIVAGGTPTYSIHNKRKEVECSPGTFVYWDKGYDEILPEQQYKFAALVLSRIISKPAENIICVDLGHKAIASENPLNNRVYFLNASELEPIGHSEEHMIFKTDGKKNYMVGDVLYGLPHHICPTVALHDQAYVIEKQQVTGYWDNISRNRKITI